MLTVLLVDDDSKDLQPAIECALDGAASVACAETRASALSYIKSHGAELAGVIVDLNLTRGSDQLGRDILEDLRERQIPCIVYSATISDHPDDRRSQSERLISEFGVLAVVGKTAHGSAVDELRALRAALRLVLAKATELTKRHAVDRVESLRARAAARVREEYRRWIERAPAAAAVGGLTATTRLRRLAETELNDSLGQVEALCEAARVAIGAAAADADFEELLTALAADLSL